jgi:hypothetical protein
MLQATNRRTRMMTTLGEIRTPLILSHTLPNTTASLIVPGEIEGGLDAEMRHWQHPGLDPRFTAIDPLTGERRRAFTPVPPGRLGMIHSRGIRHADRFLAIFEVRERTYEGQLRREMWLANAEPLAQPVAPT